MASKLIRLAENLDIDDSLGDDTSELSLVDDQDDTLQHLGQLEIDACTDEESDQVVYEKVLDEPRLRGDEDLDGRSPSSRLESIASASESVHFEVIKARIAVENRKKYVIYTIVILRTTQPSEGCHAVIQRRYSDLERFNKRLRKRFPAIMDKIAFPRKVLSGNFDQKLIAQRSRGFEQFLTHINSINEIRLSADFADFFYAHDLRLAHAHVREGLYEESIPLFINTITLQDQLLGQNHKEVVATLCGLVAAYNALDRPAEACRHALIALKRLGTSENNRFLIPLLQTAIRLCWRLGKDKTDLEARLADLRERRFPIDLAPSLIGLTLQRFED